MNRRPVAGASGRSPAASLDGGLWLVLILAGACLVLLLATGFGRLGAAAPTGTEASPAANPGGQPASPAASGDPASFLYPVVRDAPPLGLLDPDGQPLTLASLRGQDVLVFFGYTHCPDVCPATIGVVEQAMAAFGGPIRTLFVTVDPERDTQAWLKEFDSYRSPLFTGLTGSVAQIRATADAWGVKYARVETGVADAYSMAHTADVFAVDAGGRLRAHFPLGTTAAQVVASLHLIDAEPAPSGSIQPVATGGAPTAGNLTVQVDSTSVWAGSPEPVILSLTGPAGRLDDTSIEPAVQLITGDGQPVGSPIAAISVRPPGLDAVSYVALVSVPSPGSWRLAVTATPGSLPLSGSTDLLVLDPGATAAIGSAAPAIRSPTLSDVAGAINQLSTDPIPDLKLYAQSTSDLLAAHQPFVLVFDSARFRVTSACGKALIMARYLADRWSSTAFVHVEPFRYDIVTDTPVLEGSLADPSLTPVADAWGIGSAPWGPTSMPWVFIVDGQGTVRAKYQGVMGSADVDVLLAFLGQGG
jgi:protein SCO1